MVQIRFDDFVVDENEPFERDSLDRQRGVETLCRLIVRVESAAVVAVNGRFGSGKSVFLKMCAAHLRGQDVAVAEFNAWQQSHTREPLVDLVSALTGATSVGERLRETAVNLAWRAANVASRGFVAREDFSEAEVAAKFAEWKQVEQKRAEFRGALAELAAAKDNKLVVLIDELDRCLPAQALELLDVMRHLFDVPGVVVVLGINRDELCQRVKRQYGDECNAETYLRRFVDLTIDLPEPSGGLLTGFLDRTFAAAGIGDRLQASEDRSGPMLTALVERSGMSLRDMEQMAHRVARILAPVPRPNYSDRWVWEYAVIAWYVLHVVAPAAYNQFRRGESTVFAAAREMMDALSIDTETARSHAPIRTLLTVLISFGDHSGDRSTQEQFESDVLGSGLGDAALARVIWEGLIRLERPWHVNEIFDVLELSATSLRIG